MKNIIIGLICTFSFLSATTQGKGTAAFSKGGSGFLFSDANSFNNGGQMAQTMGTAVEGYYTRHNQLNTQSFTPSAVWGSGKVGLGAFASRSGSALTGADSVHADSAGAGLGVSLAQGRVTVGGTMSRSLDTAQSNDGTVNAALNYNGSKGMGFHMGGGFGTTLNSSSNTETRTATLALGWGFSSMANFEVDYQLKDLDNTSNNYTVGSYLNFGGSSYYIGTGYIYDKPSEESSVSGRLGYVMGSLDFSVHGEHTLLDGQSPYYGATLRAAF